MEAAITVLADGGPTRDAIRERGTQLGVHPLLVRMLASRGIVDREAQGRALRARLADLRAPESMAGFEEALALLCEARARGWRVGVFGDYDVDGVCTATILSTYLEALGVEVVCRVARRESGYGFTVGDAEAFAEAGATLVLTGDTGTSDIEALGWLRAQGIRSAVIDHHQVPEQAPPTDAFINPHQAGCGFPFKGLCSAGVAFYLCAALRTRLRDTDSSGQFPDPRAWLDLVAVATVCDMMPLVEENRILVRHGLRLLSQRRRPGLRALLEAAGVEPTEVIDEEHIGYKLGPRLNAPGRLGAAAPAMDVLRARTDAEAGPLAEHVEMLNERRKRHTQSTIAEALALMAAGADAGRGAVVVAHDTWLPGVVGIAASAIVEHCGRPALVLAIDRASGLARGSVRSIGGIDVRLALAQCAELVERFGGHREAAGVTVRAERVDALAEAFATAVEEQEAPPAVDGEVVDGPLPLRCVDVRLTESLRSLGPYGVGFPAPRFVARDLVVERVRVLKDKHLALTLQHDGARHDAIAFGQADQELVPGQRVGCIYVPVLDHFRGETRLRLRIQRVWPTP